MYKHFALSLCLLCTAFAAAAQCPVTPILLSTQAQVDAFPADYPNCTDLVTLLTITGANITNLDGLENIETTANSIILRDNPMLSSLSGLSNLTSIGVELKIENNDALTDLSGLNNLTWLGGHLSIEGNALLATLDGMGPIPSLGSYLNISFNPVLTDISALNNLTEVGPSYVNGFLAINNNNSLTAINGLDLISECGSYFFLGSNPAMTTINGLNGLNTVNSEFSITGNPVLSSLDGLTSLSTVHGDFIIDLNPVLTDLSEFDNLQTVDGNLVVVSNAALADCAALGICLFLQGTGSAFFTNNAPGCNSVAQVEAACSLLPVELIFFRGVREEDAILLTWQTAAEKNNDHFLVEHQSEGGDFQTVGMVMGNGTTSVTNNYQFQHQRPSKGLNYYRLRQVDFDGNFKYSNIVGIMTMLKDDADIFPNPTTGPVWVKGEVDGERDIRVRDFAGRIILEKNLSESSLVDLSDQPNGIYFIEIQKDAGKIVKRIVKK